MSAIEAEANVKGEPGTSEDAVLAPKSSWPTIEKYVSIDASDNLAGASARARESIAIGSQAVAGESTSGVGYGSIAVGVSAFAHAGGSISIGTKSQALGNESLALGYGSSVAGLAVYSVALGLGASATHGYAVALGANSATDKAHTISVGTAENRRAIRNVADAELSESSHEAVTGSQLFATNQKIDRLQSGNKYIAVVSYAGATDAVASNPGDVAIGPAVSSRGGSAFAAGSDTQAHNGQTVAIGVKARAFGYGALAIGSHAESDANDDTSLGHGAAASGGAGLALGPWSSAQHASAVALGGGSVTDRANTVSVGAIDRRRAIRFVANGDLSAGSHEAVTGGQLFATNQKVEASEATIAEQADDIAAGAARIDTLSEQISSGRVGLVQQNATSHVLTIGTATNGTLINAAGTQGTRRLTGLSDGQDDADAVTVKQLDAVRNDPLLTRYDSSARTQLTFNPKGSATRLSNVLPGQDAKDAVNKSQLDGVDKKVDRYVGTLTDVANQLMDLELNAITYDPDTQAIPVEDAKITGLADGTDAGDAVNKGQLDQAVASVDQKLSGAVAYSNSAHTLVSLNPNDAPARLTNLATGTVDGDAVNFGQLSPVLDKARFLAVDGKTDAKAEGTDALAVGGGASAKKEYGVAVGSKASANGSYDVAIGRSASATSEFTSDGYYFTGVAVGYGSRTLSSGIAIGMSAVAGMRGSLAIGAASEAAAKYAICLGPQATSAAEASVALGRRAACTAAATDAVALGAGSLADQPGTISVGNNELKRRLTNVAPGLEGSDAVIVSQFQELKRAYDLLESMHRHAEERADALEQGVSRLSARMDAYQAQA